MKQAVSRVKALQLLKMSLAGSRFPHVFVAVVDSCNWSVI
jgi:hypothetical protein